MTTLRLTTASPVRARADAVVVGVVASARGPRLAAGSEPVDAALDGRLRSTLKALGATGKAGEVLRLPGGGTGASVVVAVGLGGPLGPSADDLERLRRAAGEGARAAAGSAAVAVALPAESVEQVAAVAEGCLLGAYAFRRYRATTAADHKPPVRGFVVTTPRAASRAARQAVTSAQVTARAVALARDLVNTPANDLHPADFAAAAEAAARGLGLAVEVLDERALRRRGFGGIVAVGQGSANPPRLVRVAYRHRAATRHLALVGKGITFDSGGLSLKPAQAMEWMKSDMGGAAAVLAALTAVARLKPVVNVTGYLALAENMPSGTAQRPSDVITIYGGRTVEVVNTDAEGRLVLADALVRCLEEDPDLVVDAATLTGAQLVALGPRTAGVMANDALLRDQLVEAATEVGESMWPMPLPDDLRPSLDSEIADLKNLGDRFGGMLTAGLFLREFVPAGTPWAHLDIAGPAYNEWQPYGYTPKGGTGAAVRTLVRLAQQVAAGHGAWLERTTSIG